MHEHEHVHEHGGEMKEAPEAFEGRSGRRYDPPAGLRELVWAFGGRVLEPDEACPTLFRYPGPQGIASFLQSRSARLGTGLTPWVWLAAVHDGTRDTAARLFGSVAVLEPMALQPCPTPCFSRLPNLYLAVDTVMTEGSDLLWLPPSAVARAVDLDGARTAEEARERLGPDYDDEREAVGRALSGYLEELSALQRAGGEMPPLPWHDIPEDERRERLARHGLGARWTASR